MKRSASAAMLTPEPQDLGSDSVNGSSAAQNSSNSSKKVGEAPMQMIHKPSGYKYEREEDAPGYSWKSKRAFDEIQRSWDSVVQRDTYIGGR